MSKRNVKKAKKIAKKYPKIVIVLAVLVLIAAIILGVMYFKKIGPFKDKAAPPDNLQGELAEISSAEFSVHFLELGNKYTGDSVLIKSGDTEVLIDAGSKVDSAKTLKSYIDGYCKDGVLEYVIATHAHEDHIAGLVGVNENDTKTGILYQYKVGTLIEFAGTNQTENATLYNNYKIARAYAESKGTTVYTAKQCWYETDGAKKTYYLDEAQTVSLNILYQIYYDEKASSENDYSVCTLLKCVAPDKTYNCLFTGDLEKNGEISLANSNDLPEVDLFKAGHHGSDTSSNDVLLNKIKPKNIAVCCCCGSPEYTQNANNTFPKQTAIDRFAKHTQNIYVTTIATGVAEIVDGKHVNKKWDGFTSMNGNIVFYLKQGENALKLYCSNNTTILKDTEWFKANRKWNP